MHLFWGAYVYSRRRSRNRNRNRRFARLRGRFALHTLDVAKARPGMLVGQSCAGAEQLFAQRAWRIVARIHTAALQLGNEVLDYMLEGLMRDRIGQIETVYAGRLDPLLQD